MTGRRPVLRRLGGAAVTVAVLALGAAGGLILGSPASAAGSGSIEVRMAGQQDFSASAPDPLLTIGDLAPGGSVSGSMDVRLASDTGDAGGDTLGLQMIDVVTGDDCDAGVTCAGSGQALADALEFTLDVSDSATGSTLHQSAETVGALQDGVTLAPGLTTGDVVSMTLSASLPATAGNDVAYGRLAFKLQLGISAATPGTNGGDDGEEGGGTEVEVLGTGQTQPLSAGAGDGPGAGDQGNGNDEVLVLGQGEKSLSYTGTPIIALVTIGGVCLLLGAGLMLRARRQH